MEWAYLTKAIVFTIALFLLPGLLVTGVSKQRGFAAIGPAPSISVAIIAGSAVVAPLLGVKWSIWVPVIFTVVLAVLVYFVTRIMNKKTSSPFPMENSGSRSISPVSARNLLNIFTREDAWYGAAIIVAGSLIWSNLQKSIQKPDWPSQAFDGVFHLNAIRYIIETGNASSLFVGGVTNSNGTPAYYPAAWHDVASLIVMYTGIDVFSAANVITLIICAVVWPVSVLYMLFSFIRVNGAGIVIAGIASAGLVGFPYMLIDWGVLYPNMLGIALMPAAVGLVTQVLRINLVGRVSIATGIVLGFLSLIGVALAHPNIAMSLLIAVVPGFLVKIFLSIQGYRKQSISKKIMVAEVVLMFFALVAVRILWGIVRPAPGAGTWEPQITQGQGVGEAMTNSPMGYATPGILTILMFSGIYILARRRDRGIWLLLSWIYYIYFFSSARWLSWEDGREWVTGVWYNDPYRIAAIMPTFTVIFCGIFASFAVKSIIKSAFIYRFTRSIKWRYLSPFLSIVFTITSAYYVGAYSQQSKSLEAIETKLNDHYNIEKNNYLLSESEVDMFKQLDNYVPSDDTVVVVPATGASLAYAYSGRRVTETHFFYTRNQDTDIISRELNKAKSNPQVCEAVNDMKAYYVLDFGPSRAFNTRGDDEYIGLDNLATSDVVHEVFRTGPETVLYKVTACQ